MRVRRANRAEILHGTRERTPSPRQLEAQRRDDQLRRALNEAATRPASEVVVVETTGSERIQSIRAALVRLLEHEPRELNWGLRDGRILITKGALPRRSRRPSTR